MGALGALVWGCAGELDKDPESFTNAYTKPGATGGSGTGGSSGGSTGMTGGTTATGGTTGTGGSGDVIPPDDACVAGVLASNACTACHSTASASSIGADLVLEGTNLGARLSTTKATYKGVAANAGACVQGALIIDPVTPANSILLKKVAGTQACGDKMPMGSGLSGASLQCIQDWIAKF